MDSIVTPLLVCLIGIVSLGMTLATYFWRQEQQKSSTEILDLKTRIITLEHDLANHREEHRYPLPVAPATANTRKAQAILDDLRAKGKIAAMTGIALDDEDEFDDLNAEIEAIFNPPAPEPAPESQSILD